MAYFGQYRQFACGGRPGWYIDNFACILGGWKNLWLEVLSLDWRQICGCEGLEGGTVGNGLVSFATKQEADDFIKSGGADELDQKGRQTPLANSPSRLSK